MSVALTSRESYSQHVSSGNKLSQRDAIMDKINIAKDHKTYQVQGGLHKRKIQFFTGFEIGATAGRVNLLVKDGLLVDKGTIKCWTTGQTVGLVGLPEKQGQLI